VAMAAGMRGDQRPPGVRADLPVGQQVVVALEVPDGMPGVGAEDAVSRHPQQTLEPDHQLSGAPAAQDLARYGVALGGVRRLRDDQRRGCKAQAHERAQRPAEWIAGRFAQRDRPWL